MTVHLHTTLQRQTPEGLQRRVEITLPSGSTVADLLARLQIPFRQESTLLVVNGRQADVGQPLHESDEVHLIPALSGGASEHRSATHTAAPRTPRHPG